MRFHVEDLIFQVEIFGIKRFLNHFEFQWDLTYCLYMIITYIWNLTFPLVLSMSWGLLLYLQWRCGGLGSWWWMRLWPPAAHRAGLGSLQRCLDGRRKRLPQWNGRYLCHIFAKGFESAVYFVFRINMQIDLKCKMRVSNNVTTCLWSDFCRICCHFMYRLSAKIGQLLKLTMNSHCRSKEQLHYTESSKGRLPLPSPEVGKMVDEAQLGLVGSIFHGKGS